MKKIDEYGKICANSYNIHCRTGVRVYMGISYTFHFLNFVIFLHSNSYRVVVFCGRSVAISGNLRKGCVTLGENSIPVASNIYF